MAEKEILIKAMTGKTVGQAKKADASLTTDYPMPQLFQWQSFQAFLGIYIILFISTIILLDVPMLLRGHFDSILPRVLKDLQFYISCQFVQDPLSCHPKIWYKTLVVLVDVFQAVNLYFLVQYFKDFQPDRFNSDDLALVTVIGHVFSMMLSSCFAAIPAIMELVFNPIVDSAIRPLLLFYIPMLLAALYLIVFLRQLWQLYSSPVAFS
jgi:hypothetical protein